MVCGLESGSVVIQNRGTKALKVIGYMGTGAGEVALPSIGPNESGAIFIYNLDSVRIKVEKDDAE